MPRPAAPSAPSACYVCAHSVLGHGHASSVPRPLVVWRPSLLLLLRLPLAASMDENTETTSSDEEGRLGAIARIARVWQEKIGDPRGLPWTERTSKEEVECHKEIASFVRERVLELEAVARREYYGTDPSSPYGPLESDPAGNGNSPVSSQA